MSWRGGRCLPLPQSYGPEPCRARAKAAGASPWPFRNARGDHPDIRPARPAKLQQRAVRDVGCLPGNRRGSSLNREHGSSRRAEASLAKKTVNDDHLRSAPPPRHPPAGPSAPALAWPLQHAMHAARAGPCSICCEPQGRWPWGSRPAGAVAVNPGTRVLRSGCGFPVEISNKHPPDPRRWQRSGPALSRNTLRSADAAGSNQ